MEHSRFCAIRHRRINGQWSMDVTMSAQLAQKRECSMVPEPHQHAVESDGHRIYKTCPTSRWKSCRSRCRSTDAERTSPAAVTDEPSACHSRWSHASLADQSGCRRGRQQWQTRDAANDVLDVVAVLIIFFEDKLVHALQHSLGVVKPATGDGKITPNAS